MSCRCPLKDIEGVVQYPPDEALGRGERATPGGTHTAIVQRMPLLNRIVDLVERHPISPVHSSLFCSLPARFYLLAWAITVTRALSPS